MPLRPSHSAVAARIAVLLLATTLTGTVAGCGSDDPPVASTPATTADELVAPEGGTVSPEPTTTAEGAGTVSNGSADKGAGDFTPPKGADAPGAPRISVRKGLRVESDEGAKPRWVVKANGGDEGEFCVHLSIPGPYDPDPQCQTGELVALQFFGDDATGPAIGNVVQAPLTRREPTSQMVVAGIAAGNVKKVRVRYGTKLYDAKMSDAVVDLPIDQRMARELSGATRAQIDRLPDPVTVRAFGVSFPREAGNPPRVVTAETPRPVDGVITLQLS